MTRPDAGRQLCRDAILKYIDTDMIDEYDEYIDEQREIVKDRIVELMQQGGES